MNHLAVLAEQDVAVLRLLPLVTLLATVLVAVARRWALARSVLDHPNARSSHTQPTPRGGGIGIVAATLLTWWTLPALNLSVSPAIAVVLCGASAMAILSLWEDIAQSLTARLRLAGHFLIAAGVVVGLLLIHSGDASLGYRALAALVAVVWLVGVTNAYNFMDGIDGIAGGQAVVAGAGWCLLGWLAQLPDVAAIGGTLAAASLGFLVYNWPPARIFMGDVGSTFLGFSLAGLTLAAAQHEPRLAVCGLLLVWPFLFDTSFTLLRRAVRRENLLAAHRSHLYQRLVIAGWSHRRVSLLYCALASVGFAAALAWQVQLPYAGLAAIAAVVILATALWRLVVWQEHTAAPRVSGAQSPA